MTTTGSSIISSLGAGSGIDFGRLATDLSEVTFANQRQTLGDTNARLEARISAVSNLRGMVTSLVSALGDRLRGGDLAARANLSNPAIANVTALPGTAPRGSYTLEVTQLARAQRLVMPPLASSATPVGSGSLTIRFGSVDGADFAEDTARPAITLDVAAGETSAAQ
jgi:flagellar hook-associated protein 2